MDSRPGVRIRLATASVALVVLLVACGSDGTPTPPTSVRVTTAAAPANACMDALITGILVPHAAWGIGLQTPGTGELTRPIFPFGYSAVVDGDRLALLDEKGRLVAHTGDLIQSGGGSIDPGSVVLCGGIEVVPG
ncbi:MAG: hypothetical protein A2V84_06260 [Chloroflexi bacterium RBG_16_70_13]|nr:MAG: hypothetical protein A2V84_06260 [Chloroflexi bacterium RBG_16_70_13]